MKPITTIIAILVVLALVIVGLSMMGYIDVGLPGFLGGNTTNTEENKFVGRWEVTSINGLDAWDDSWDAYFVFFDDGYGQLFAGPDASNFSILTAFYWSVNTNNDLVIEDFMNQDSVVEYVFSNSDTSLLITSDDDDMVFTLEKCQACGG